MCNLDQAEMSARILFIGDPHIKSNDLIRSRIMCEDIIRIAKEEMPDRVVIMGDTLHNHNEFSAEPHTEAVLFIAQLFEQVAPVVLLIGNHDIPGPNYYMTHLHPFLAFKYCPQVTVVDQAPTVITVGMHKFLALPYVPEGMFNDAIEECDLNEAPTAIFAHNEFCPNGKDPWSTDMPLIISGHIHDYGWPQENVCYVGTPRMIAVDEDTVKTVSLFTFTERGTFHEKRIVVNTPPKLEYRIMFDEIPTWRPPVDIRNAYVKIFITGTVAETITAKKHPHIVKWKREGANIVYNTINDEMTEEERREIFNVITKGSHRISFRAQYEKRIADDPVKVEIYKRIVY
jgi:hypothetical protein